MAEMQEYLTFLSDLRQALDRLTQLEQQKIQAVQAGNLDELDQCMKQEQAAALDLRGREQRREALLKQLGLEGTPLRDLPLHCSASEKQQASEISQQVLRSYKVLASAQQTARTLMESNLRHIQKELEHREANPQPQTSVPRKPQTDFRA